MMDVVELLHPPRLMNLHSAPLFTPRASVMHDYSHTVACDEGGGDARPNGGAAGDPFT